MIQVQESEKLKIVPLIDPDILTAAAHSVADIDVRRFARAILLLQLGVITATCTVDTIVRHSDTAGGTYATIFTATQLLVADDSQIHYLDINLLNPNIKGFLTVTVTVAADVGDGAAILILDQARSEPVPQPADVQEMAGTWATGIFPP